MQTAEDQPQLRRSRSEVPAGGSAHALTFAVLGRPACLEWGVLSCSPSGRVDARALPSHPRPSRRSKPRPPILSSRGPPHVCVRRLPGSGVARESADRAHRDRPSASRSARGRRPRARRRRRAARVTPRHEARSRCASRGRSASQERAQAGSRGRLRLRGRARDPVTWSRSAKLPSSRGRTLRSGLAPRSVTDWVPGGARPAKTIWRPTVTGASGPASTRPKTSTTPRICLWIVQRNSNLPCRVNVYENVPPGGCSRTRRRRSRPSPCDSCCRRSSRKRSSRRGCRDWPARRAWPAS